MYVCTLATRYRRYSIHKYFHAQQQIRGIRKNVLSQNKTRYTVDSSNGTLNYDLLTGLWYMQCSPEILDTCKVLSAGKTCLLCHVWIF